jgi:hypothetical protein
VRPIYRKGDRVLVEPPFGYCDVLVEWCEVEGGRLRLYGVCGGWASASRRRPWCAGSRGTRC